MKALHLAEGFDLLNSVVELLGNDGTQLNIFRVVATMYANDTHASVNHEQSFSPYNQKS
jgi:hypothetical protein